MKPKKIREAERLRQSEALARTSESVGLAPELYACALRYLFERTVPRGQEQEWFWNLDEPEFEATPLEWTRIQTVLFANAGHDLACYNDEQVGMGLNYVMSNSISNVAFAAIDVSVPVEEAMRMMAAMPRLWKQCFGPRLGTGASAIGSRSDRLYFACYMWFDVWPTFWNVRQSAPWRQALWEVFRQMLEMPWRDVQVAALHGIGHNVRNLDQQPIDAAIDRFLRTVAPWDTELKDYAHAARRGLVQ